MYSTVVDNYVFNLFFPCWYKEAFLVLHLIFIFSFVFLFLKLSVLISRHM